MRIAILCNARTGSNSLYNFLEGHLKKLNENYYCISEPFNDNPSLVKIRNIDYETINDFLDKKNVLIKTFSTAFKPNKTFEKWEDYWVWFFEYFDKIILLDRKDKRLQSESLTFHMKFKDKFSVNYNWHTPKYYDLKPEDENEINNFERDLIYASQILHSHKEKGYPLFYYEDIYLEKNLDVINKLMDYLNLKLNEGFYNQWILSSDKIVRMKEKQKNINSLI